MPSGPELRLVDLEGFNEGGREGDALLDLLKVFVLEFPVEGKAREVLGPVGNRDIEFLSDEGDVEEPGEMFFEVHDLFHDGRGQDVKGPGRIVAQDGELLVEGDRLGLNEDQFSRIDGPVFLLLLNDPDEAAEIAPEGKAVKSTLGIGDVMGPVFALLLPLKDVMALLEGNPFVATGHVEASEVAGRNVEEAGIVDDLLGDGPIGIVDDVPEKSPAPLLLKEGKGFPLVSRAKALPIKIKNESNDEDGGQNHEKGHQKAVGDVVEAEEDENGNEGEDAEKADDEANVLEDAPFLGPLGPKGGKSLLVFFAYVSHC